MAEPLDFETTLAARLEARAAIASGPFDPVAIATAAIATRPVRRLALRWPTGAMRWALLGGAAILAALAGALLAATLLRDDDRGQLLAVAWSDGAYLAHADGTEPHLLLTSDTITELAWSADGTLLLVMDLVPTGNECCVGRATVLRTDGSVAWTVEGPTVGGVVWAHRGHRIASVDFHGVTVTDLDTGAARRLADMPPAVDGAARVMYNGWGSVDWSPDDTRIATTGSVQSDTGGNVMVIVPVDGGSPVQLTSSTGPDMQMPAWSPDGRSIAVLRTTNLSCAADEIACDPSVVAILDATTGRETGSGGTMPFPFRWSPDGSRIAWTGATSPDKTAVFVDRLPLGDGDTVQLDAQRLAGWTPDGQGLLVVRPGPASPEGQTFDLWRMDPDGSNAVLLVRGATNGALQPTP